MIYESNPNGLRFKSFPISTLPDKIMQSLR